MPRETRNKGKPTKKAKPVVNKEALAAKKKARLIKKELIKKGKIIINKFTKKIHGFKIQHSRSQFLRNIRHPSTLKYFSDPTDWKLYPISNVNKGTQLPVIIDTSIIDKEIKPIPEYNEDEVPNPARTRTTATCKGCKKRIYFRNFTKHHKLCKKTKGRFLNPNLSLNRVKSEGDNQSLKPRLSNTSKKMSKNGKEINENKKHVKPIKEHGENKKLLKATKNEVENKKLNKLIHEDIIEDLESSPVPEESKARRTRSKTNHIQDSKTIPTIAITKADNFNELSNKTKEESVVTDTNSLLPESIITNTSKSRGNKKDSNNNESKENKKKMGKQKKEKNKVKEKPVLDLDKHCGVLGANGQACMRLITCKAHTVVLKKAVFGRSKTYQELVALHQKNNAKIKAENLAQKAGMAAKEASQHLHDHDNSSYPHNSNKRRRSFGESSDFDSDLECDTILKAIKLTTKKPMIAYHRVPLLKTYQLKRCQTMMQRDIYDKLHPPEMDNEGKGEQLDIVDGDNGTDNFVNDMGFNKGMEGKPFSINNYKPNGMNFNQNGRR